jgi:hypothetical protein
MVQIQCYSKILESGVNKEAMIKYQCGDRDK